MAHGEIWFRNAAVRHGKNATRLFRKATIIHRQAANRELSKEDARQQVSDLVRRGCEETRISINLIDRFIAEVEKNYGK
jgi:hypothetical protein